MGSQREPVSVCTLTAERLTVEEGPRMEGNYKGKGLDMAPLYVIAFEVLLLRSLYRTSLPAIRGSSINIEHWSKLWK